MNGNVAVDRDALYYPYIHINDVNWLKATLLSFPNVRRMVPRDYPSDDSPEIQEFCNTEGPRGPLLTSADLFSPEAVNSEMTLLALLGEHDALIRSRYSKRRTLETPGGGQNLFKVHTEKIVENLYIYLTAGGDDALAWWTASPTTRPERSSGHWLALHPVLGEAILATKAIAIAQGSGLNIVTDSDYVHHTVVIEQKEQLFKQLLQQPIPTNAPNQHDTIDDLSEIVIKTTFDVSKFSAKDIAALLSDGKDLRRFKNALAPLAAQIPPMTNQKERKDRLRAAAADVVTEWGKYKKSLPRLALDAISDTANIKWPELASPTVLGVGSVLSIGAGAGIGVFLVSYSGFKIWRRYREQAASPYSYLSRIRKLQGRTEPSLTLPPIVYPGF